GGGNAQRRVVARLVGGYRGRGGTGAQHRGQQRNDREDGSHARIFAGLRASVRERQPSASVERFQRTEAALVVHLVVAVDPVAQVQVLQALAPRPFQLPQDAQRAQAARGFFRFVEGV